MNEDIGSIESTLIDAGHKHLLASELQQRLLGNTILGDFAFLYKYIMTISPQGELEGINNVGSHHIGNMVIDEAHDTITVQWKTGWVNNTTRAYDIEDKIKLFDIGSGQWSTTFTKIMDGTDYPMVPPQTP